MKTDDLCTVKKSIRLQRRRELQTSAAQMNPWISCYSFSFLRNLFAPTQYCRAAKDKKPFPFLIRRNCGGCARRIQTQTWRRCLPRSESYQRRSLQGSAEQSQLFDSQCDSSINLREIVPLKFHYSFHHDVGLSSLHLSASVVSKGLLTQQSDIKWRGGGGGGGRGVEGV